MSRKRDDLGRFQKRSDKYSTKIVGFRVTEDEYQLIRQAKKFGFEPREIVLEKARKVVNDDRVNK